MTASGPPSSAVLAVWPRVESHKYLQLFHQALRRRGVAWFDGTWPHTNHQVRSVANEIDGLHFHWPEFLWQQAGPGDFARTRAQLGLWSFLRTASGSGLTIVWTLHNLDPHESRLTDRIGVWLVARHTDLAVCHGALAEQFLHRRFPALRDRTVVMPHGNFDGAFPSPADGLATRRRLNLPEDARVLLAPGLIRPYKGLLPACAAMTHLDGRYRLVIAGPANDAAHLREVKNASERDARIVLIPRGLSDQEFADLHEAADCVLLPYARITTSGALLTALTLGRGVVVSDLPYFREVLGSDRCAEFAPPGDVAGLAGAIQRYFEDGQDRGQAARRLAEAFSWDTIVEPVARRILELSAGRRWRRRP